MNDEELRKFCIEQAILIINQKREFRGFRDFNQMTVFKLSDALFDYVKTGVGIDIHVNYLY